MSTQPKRRWVPAPNDTAQAANSAVLGVSLDSNERVEWAYAIRPDGRRVVTGYDVLPILSAGLEEMLKGHYSTFVDASATRKDRS